MSNSEKLDKLIQMVRDLDKRVVVIQNVLGVKVTSPTPTFNTLNFGTRFHRLLQHLRLLSLISFPKKFIVERVLMRDVCEIPVFQPLMKIKKRLVQQDSQNIEAGFDLLKLRQINNPDLFLNKTALVVGVKFLEEIDELYDEFLDDKKGFQFGTGFDKYNIEKNINFLYSAIAVAEKYWLGVVVNLEKRSITAFNCAAMKFTDASLVPYVNAYAMALPFMIRNFFKDVSMDTSKFSIKIVSEGFPQVDVKCILGDPELHSDLVEDVDCEFGRVVDLVKRGYRLKRQDWLNGSVDIAVAEAEVVSLEEKVKYLEGLLNIRGETVNETEKSKETEAATKTKGKKNGVRPPREVDHQEEDDTEVEHGAKESDTSKVNEEQPHEEEEQEVDVDDGDKESENSETNEVS
ncbi:hypothetical protein Bca52824_073920 [Brassica carinata]|uniref:Ubiquitin-like protease family profile domain-containing protein n=1 Tax=Brassica carinata TaxID=52824 RepID=A0A8X7U8F8_BRACI|nr:hypothetical protein Bca52824_073920 [Brassica carinata]